MLCLGQCVALVAMCFWFFFLFFIPLFLKLKKSNGSGEFMCVRNVCIVVVVLPGQLFRQLFWQKASTTLSFSFLWNLLHPSLQIIRTWALPGGRSLYISKRIATGYWSADYSGHLGSCGVHKLIMLGFLDYLKNLFGTLGQEFLSHLLFFDACSVTAQCPLPETISI